MCRLLWGIVLASLILVPDLAGAGQPETPAQTLQAIRQEQRQASTKLDKTYDAAKTEADKQRVFEEYRKANEACARRALALAKKYPHDPAAFDALEWLISGGVGWNAATPQALDLVRHDYVRDKRLGKIVSAVSSYWNLYAPGEQFTRDVMAKNPDRRVQGLAASRLAALLYSFAGRAAYMRKDPKNGTRWVDQAIVERIRRSTPEQLKKETEAAYQHIIDKYADVKPLYGKRTLGQQAEATLFAMRHLQVGQVAPEIEGEDIDGHRFKLSDYRGKVVLLDFWGNW